MTEASKPKPTALKQLYKLEILGRAGSGKTTRAMEIFDRRKEHNLSTSVVVRGGACS